VQTHIHALVVEADVDGVLPQRLVVRAGVDTDGKDSVGLETSGGHVHIQLA
jgi:hypothetical protein